MISEIIIDPAIQTRARINDAVVKEYADELMAGTTFPAVVVFDDGNKKYLADGFHRLAPAKQVRRDGMSFEEAAEYCDFNIEGAYMGEKTPVIFWDYDS